MRLNKHVIGQQHTPYHSKTMGQQNISNSLERMAAASSCWNLSCYFRSILRSHCFPLADPPWSLLRLNNFLHRGHPFMTSTRRGEGEGSCGRMWTGGGGPAPCGRPHRKLKLESTDVILSSSHAKNLVHFLPEFRLWTE